jgi:hypothetical protein
MRRLLGLLSSGWLYRRAEHTKLLPRSACIVPGRASIVAFRRFFIVQF